MITVCDESRVDVPSLAYSTLPQFLVCKYLKALYLHPCRLSSLLPLIDERGESFGVFRLELPPCLFDHRWSLTQDVHVARSCPRGKTQHSLHEKSVGFLKNIEIRYRQMLPNPLQSVS